MINKKGTYYNEIKREEDTSLKDVCNLFFWLGIIIVSVVLIKVLIF